ncbi:MAG: hypothetical protein M3301_07060 [Chloroflexota bacterium]|nr:hypothetical protein [Chloroflexota bacterium]
MPRSFAIDLYRRRDFVSQATKDYCVPAAVKTMINMIGRSPGRATPSQGRIYRLARELSSWRLVGGGAEAEGWAGALNELGYGPYVVRAERTRAGAIETAARALRTTRRPVGLMVWRGAHSWVMSGFRATADPAATGRFRVTHVYVQDPWYPRISSIWGASRPPDALVPARLLTEDYLPFRRPTVRYPEKDGLFVLVLPVSGN